jgi:hypothetical protein
MAKFEVSVSNGLVGCTQRQTVEIEDSELEDLNAQERDDYIEEVLREYVLDSIFRWDYKEIK